MSKKHFEAVAAAVRAQVNSAQGSEAVIEGIAMAMRAFCEVARQANPRFDSVRFWEACGLSR